MPRESNPFAALNGLVPEAKEDPLTPLVVDVLDEVLATADVVTPVEVLVRLEILTPEQVSAWRRGQLPYLERAITAGLQKVGRLLRVLDSQARAKGLVATEAKHWRSGKGPKRRLRFTKQGDATSEASYARSYVRPTTR
jgi:hypothetical protein